MGMGKWFWPKKGPLSSRNYAMIFERSKMDVLERRNKKNSPCIEDWKNHDQYVMENLISAAGCRPPHWTSKQDVRICNSQEEMLKVLPPLKKHELLDFVPPCRSIIRDIVVGNPPRYTKTVSKLHSNSLNESSRLFPIS